MGNVDSEPIDLSVKEDKEVGFSDGGCLSGCRCAKGEVVKEASSVEG